MRFKQLQSKEKAEYITMLLLFPFLLLLQRPLKSTKLFADKKHRIITSVMCAVVILVVLPITVFAAGNKTAERVNAPSANPSPAIAEKGNIYEYTSPFSDSPNDSKQSCDSSSDQIYCSDLFFYLILLFISGGTVTGLIIVRRKKKPSIQIPVNENNSSESTENHKSDQ